jgi:hypothetical protein
MATTANPAIVVEDDDVHEPGVGQYCVDFVCGESPLDGCREPVVLVVDADAERVVGICLQRKAARAMRSRRGRRRETRYGRTKTL